MGRAKAPWCRPWWGCFPITAAIRLLGHTLPRSGRLPREVRDQVAYLPQKLLIDGRFPLSVSEFVRLGCSPRCHHREAVRLLWAFASEPSAPRLLSELSGGELQRVLLFAPCIRASCWCLMSRAPALIPRLLCNSKSYCSSYGSRKGSRFCRSPTTSRWFAAVPIGCCV